MAEVNDTYMGRDGDRVTLSAPPAERVATAQALLESTPYSAKAARSVTLPRVRTPTNQAGAKEILERGLGAMGDEDWMAAASNFRAVLRTDFLTDAGRANIYWFTAEAHRRLHDVSGEADALSGFLLAASILDDTPRGDRREVAARAALAAFRLSRDPDFGRTKETPIRVMDVREPISILSALGCRDRVLTNDTVTSRSGGVSLVRQQAKCGESGTVELWFDVSDASVDVDR